VQREAKILEGMGIIKLLKKENQEIKPVALYDRIVFDLSLQKRKRGESDYRTIVSPKQ
jgi:predicted transcriptional regulator